MQSIPFPGDGSRLICELRKNLLVGSGNVSLHTPEEIEEIEATIQVIKWGASAELKSIAQYIQPDAGDTAR